MYANSRSRVITCRQLKEPTLVRKAFLSALYADPVTFIRFYQPRHHQRRQSQRLQQLQLVKVGVTNTTNAQAEKLKAIIFALVAIWSWKKPINKYCIR